MGRHAAVGGDLQHVAQPELTHGGAQDRIGAVDLVAATRRPAPGLDRADEHRGGQRRLGRKPDVGGTPAAAQRCWSSVHARGRYKARRSGMPAAAA